MKSATTTLHEQLARQPGVFMSRPKEPNFFSDDENLRTRMALVFITVRGRRRGRSSRRIKHALHQASHLSANRRANRPDLPRVKLNYVMRHPIDRLVSQYVHDFTAGGIRVGPWRGRRLPSRVDRIQPIRDAVEPFLAAYGFESVLPVFFTRLVSQSQQELERIGRFLELTEPALLGFDFETPEYPDAIDLRPSPIRQALVQSPVLCRLRHRVLPAPLVAISQGILASRIEPPQITPHLTARLREVFDADLSSARLVAGDPAGLRELRRGTTRDHPHCWSARRCEVLVQPSLDSGGAWRNRKTLTSSGRMSFSPAAKPLRIRAATGLFSAGIVGRRSRNRALSVRVKLARFERERLDALPIEDVLDGRLNRFERDRGTSAYAAASGSAGARAADHLAHIVVKLNQVDEDRPLNFQQQVLLVVLELGMQPVDDPFAAGLAAKLAVEGRSQCVDSLAQVIAQPGEGVEEERPLGDRNGEAGSGQRLGRCRRPGQSSSAKPSRTSRPWLILEDEERAVGRRMLQVSSPASPRQLADMIDLGHRGPFHLRWPSLSIRARRPDVRLFFSRAAESAPTALPATLTPRSRRTRHEPSNALFTSFLCSP